MLPPTSMSILLALTSHEYQQVQPVRNYRRGHESASTLQMAPDPAVDVIVDADPPYATNTDFANGSV